MVKTASKPEKTRDPRSGIDAIISPTTLKKTLTNNLILTEIMIANLEPLDSASASLFMRNHTTSVMTFFPDRDDLRVTIKGYDKNEDKYKHQSSVEITIYNAHEREEKYIECARRNGNSQQKRKKQNCERHQTESSDIKASGALSKCYGTDTLGYLVHYMWCQAYLSLPGKSQARVCSVI